MFSSHRAVLSAASEASLFLFLLAPTVARSNTLMLIPLSVTSVTFSVRAQRPRGKLSFSSVHFTQHTSESKKINLIRIALDKQVLRETNLTLLY